MTHQLKPAQALPALNRDALDESRVQNELARAQVRKQCAWAKSVVDLVLHALPADAEAPAIVRIGATAYA